MKLHTRRATALVATVGLAAGAIALGALVPANSAAIDPWLDTAKPAVERANLMIAEMTEVEKLSLLWGTGCSGAHGESFQVCIVGIPRLGIPQSFQGDTPQGVTSIGTYGATQMPNETNMAATFSKEAALAYGDVLGQEVRGLGYSVLHGPDLDVLRDPRHGRAHEAMGEDPYLTGVMGAKYVEALQSYDVIADAKHYVLNTVERNRQGIDAQVDAKTLNELYLASFQDSVMDSDMGMMMCAYNKINGEWACDDEYTLKTVLREQWGFDTIIRTDAGASHGVGALKIGMDQHFRGAGVYSETNIRAAIASGELSWDDVDNTVRRHLVMLIEYGIFDNPPVRTGAALSRNAAMVQDIAAEGIVLLRNKNNILPFDSSVQSIAVIGPEANAVNVHGGPAQANPIGKDTLLSAITDRATGGSTSSTPGAKRTVTWELGGDPLWSTANVVGLPQIPSGALDNTTDGGYGAHATYVRGANTYNSADRLVGITSGGGFGGALVASQTIPGSGNLVSAKWEADLPISVAGTYKFDLVTSARAATLLIDGATVVSRSAADTTPATQGQVTLTSGTHTFEVNYTGTSAAFKVGWQPPAGAYDRRMQEAQAAAAASDVAIVTVRDYASEGLDRASITLPQDQDRLIKAVAAANPNTIVVIQSGSAISTDWRDDVAGIVDAWYGGTRAGAALASVLFGDVNPSGHLPVTFPESDADLPTADPEAWPGENMVGLYPEGVENGYRYFNQADTPEPVYPFGFGLSYTTFEYSNVRLSADKFEIGEAVSAPNFKDVPGIDVTFTVKNTGNRAGKTAAQVYVEFPDEAAEPTPLLKAFDKVSLQPGESKDVTLSLDQRSFAYFQPCDPADETDTYLGDWKIAEGGYTIQVGDSSATAPALAAQVEAVADLPAPPPDRPTPTPTVTVTHTVTQTVTPAPQPAPESAADWKDALSGLVTANATRRIQSDYTPESWAVYIRALETATALLAVPNANAAQIRAAFTDLNLAVASLVKSAPVAAAPPGPAPVAKVKAGQKAVRLVAGQKITISAGAYTAAGAKQTLAYKSSKTSVAKVSKAGTIRAVKPGKATIKLTAGGKSASIAVTVVAKKPAKASVAKVSAKGIPKTMAVGGVAYAAGAYSPATAIKARVTYTSSKPGVATVDKAGRIVAKAAGTTKITVKAQGKKKVYTIKVA